MTAPPATGATGATAGRRALLAPAGEGDREWGDEGSRDVDRVTSPRRPSGPPPPHALSPAPPHALSPAPPHTLAPPPHVLAPPPQASAPSARVVSRETLPPARLLEERCAALGLGPLRPGAAAALVALLDRIALEPQNLTAIEGLEDGIDRHLADSLAALALPEVVAARTAVDVGSGAGFPGLALAIARPDLAMTLVESEWRKADWLRRGSAGAPNVSVVADRSEHLARAEREGRDLALARALGPAAVALELTAPLVASGGAVVLWRGEADPPQGRAAILGAAAELGLGPPRSVAVTPFPGARRRLEVYEKVAPTRARYPRRAGRAARRPLGAGA